MEFHADRTMSVLAHFGGIDEIGLFLIPAVMAVFALRWAEKRAKHRSRDSERETSFDDDGDD
ncbi:MAG: hypothetical protein ACE5F5_09070 [Acidimicrobiia bacterium]